MKSESESRKLNISFAVICIQTLMMSMFAYACPVTTFYFMALFHLYVTVLNFGECEAVFETKSLNQLMYNMFIVGALPFVVIYMLIKVMVESSPIATYICICDRIMFYMIYVIPSVLMYLFFYTYVI